MCFGNATTGTTTSSYQANPAVAGAAKQNLQDMSQLQQAGYTAYTGNRVADFSDLQNQSFNTIGGIDPNNPNAATSQGLLQNYATAGPQSVNAESISSQMDPYMNQYVMQALAPQLEAQNQQFASQNKQLDAAATSAGAFGDSRAGIEAANLTNQQNIAQTGLIGQAYNAAFNTAIGAGAQDVSNNLAAQNANAGYNETALGRQLGGANALTGLSAADLNYQGTAAGLQQQYGAIQQQQNQAQLNVPYSDYLAAQQYPFLTGQAMDQAIGAGSSALGGTTTKTTTAPDNSGWALAGALGGAAVKAIPFSDKRLKENIKPVGKLKDGTPIKQFNFTHDPEKMTHIGVVAQDVEKKRPDAVHTDPETGFKKVDYNALTSPPKPRKYLKYERKAPMDTAMGSAA